MDSDARVVRGVNIATIIISGLHILFALFLVIMLGLSTTMLTDPEFIDEVMHEMQSSGSSAFDDDGYYNDYDYSGMSQAEAEAVVSMGITAVIAMGVGYLLCKVIALVAGIWALRNIKNPAKFGGIFGFAIAAIVVSVLTGAFISGALFVVSAVYVNRMRRAYLYTQQGYGQMPYGYAQPGQPPVQPGQTGQPPYGYGQQPGQLQGQPPYQVPQNQAPQQPVVPQQPMTTPTAPQQLITQAAPQAQQSVVPQEAAVSQQSSVETSGHNTEGVAEQSADGTSNPSDAPDANTPSEK